MPLPNFFIVGAGHCGTTSLYHLLGQHPQIFMSPVKEPAYLIFDPDDPDAPVPPPRVPGAEPFVKTLEDYTALFDGVRDEIAIGEASPQYMSRPISAKCIQRHAPQARIIVSLRHPAERVYSHLTHAAMLNQEPIESMETAIEELPERASACAPYAAMIEPYLAVFPADRVKIILLEDWKRDTVGAMQDLYGFLGVDPTFAPDAGRRHNQSQIIRWPGLRTYFATPGNAADRLRGVLPSGVRSALRRGALRILGKRPPALPATARKTLAALYRDDTLALQDMLGRDLSHWLE